ncbi:MAG: uracil-DNA glycosylase [Spirochaetales bacterium]|nr:uracil-DNA glycosylase [Spirochaetales bacterium]
MSRAIEKMWDLLNDLEDILEGGYKTARVKLRVATSAASPAARPAAKSLTEGGTGDTGSAPARDTLEAIEAEVRACKRCELGLERIKAVPGAGPRNPRVFVIGEGPGAEEDRSGIPFVGPAGRYLDKWLSAIGLSRQTDTYIGNIVKCRPPGNRDPGPEEISACIPYLMRQIEILKPRTILTVGRIAAQVLLDTTRGIGAIRGQVYRFHEIPLVATYHPSGVLRNPEYRQAVWDDLKALKSLLDEA